MGARRSLASVIIGETLNVILIKIISALDFDKYQWLVADVLDAVLGSQRHDENLAGAMIGIDIVQCESRAAGDDHPKLFPTLMTLVGQPRAGIHRDALHLVCVGAFKDVVSTPWANVFWQGLHNRRITNEDEYTNGRKRLDGGDIGRAPRSSGDGISFRTLCEFRIRTVETRVRAVP